MTTGTLLIIGMAFGSVLTVIVACIVWKEEKEIRQKEHHAKNIYDALRSKDMDKDSKT